MAIAIEKLEIQPLIPLIQQIEVEGKIFKLSFYWREYDDTILVSLLDEEENILISNDEIRLNLPLFTKYYPDKSLNIPQNCPQKLIVPLADDGYSRVGINTLFVNVHLYLVDVGYMEIKKGASYV